MGDVTCCRDQKGLAIILVDYQLLCDKIITRGEKSSPNAQEVEKGKINICPALGCIGRLDFVRLGYLLS